MKQAIKKGATIKKKGVGAIKEKMGLSTVQIADKPQGWILMPKAFREATKLPGIPTNLVVSVLGHSNVGKSTLINHAIVAAQRQGYIPVIIDTENAFSFQYAKNMGFDATPIYGDVEVEDIDVATGNVTYHTENKIVNWEGNFIYYNNSILCERFGDINYAQGTHEKTKRKVAFVEDVNQAINELLDMQDKGEVDQGFLFVWDSVGSIGCEREYGSGKDGIKKGNPMWTAGAISKSFNTLINSRIPASKKITSKYDNTFLYVNKIWMDAMTNPMGPAIMQTKGGKSLRYATRMEIVMGGQLTSGVKRLTATFKGLQYGYGIETKIKIVKNHLDAPHNICYEGKLICTDVGFISPSDLEDYKKEHITDILKELNKLSTDGTQVEEEGVVFSEEEEGVIEN